MTVNRISRNFWMPGLLAKHCKAMDTRHLAHGAMVMTISLEKSSLERTGRQLTIDD